MKPTVLATAAVLSLAHSVFVSAEEKVASGEPTGMVTSATSASTRVDPDTLPPMHGKGMMHRGESKHGEGHGGMKHGGGQHGKGHGGMKHGGSQHGKGHGGMKHSGGHQGKGHHEKNAQVVQRLDMIEARLAKIEAMLESLMRR